MKHLVTLACAVAAAILLATATGAPAAPAPRVDYPQKGKTITMIVPWAPGAGSDTTARLIATGLAKELGTTIQVVNKPGAGSQIGLSEAMAAKPDGYTLALVNVPIVNLTYLDSNRKAAYSRKDFQPVASVVMDVQGVVALANGPYKDLKDLVDAARANPERIKIGDAGLGTNAHLDMIALEKLAGVRFANVHFEGGQTHVSALLGGHIDAISMTPNAAIAQIKAGQVRVIGLMSKQGDPLFPGAKTFEVQGYPLYRSITRSFAAPAGAPKEIVDILSQAIKKVFEQDEVKKKMEDMALGRYYMDPAEFSAYWDQADVDYKDLVKLIRN